MDTMKMNIFEYQAWFESKYNTSEGWTKHFLDFDIIKEPKEQLKFNWGKRTRKTNITLIQQ